MYQQLTCSLPFPAAGVRVLPEVLGVTGLSTKCSQKVYRPEICHAGQHFLFFFRTARVCKM